jgi:hypothetical protein
MVNAFRVHSVLNHCCNAQIKPPALRSCWKVLPSHFLARSSATIAGQILLYRDCSVRRTWLACLICGLREQASHGARSLWTIVDMPRYRVEGLQGQQRVAP